MTKFFLLNIIETQLVLEVKILFIQEMYSKLFFNQHCVKLKFCRSILEYKKILHVRMDKTYFKTIRKINCIYFYERLRNVFNSLVQLHPEVCYL